PAFCNSIGGVLDEFLGIAVDRRCRFIENQNSGITDVGAKECNQLTLSGRQHHAAFFYVIIVTGGNTRYKSLNSDFLCGIDNGFASDVGIAERDIIVNRIGEQEHILEYDCDLTTKR